MSYDISPVRIIQPESTAGAGGVVAHFEYAPQGESWSIAGDVTRGSHGLVISRLEILTDTASTGVTGSLLRKISIGELLAAIRPAIAREDAKKQIKGTAVAAPASGNARRGGRPPITDDLLREVATTYLAENAPGAGAGAVKRMAEKFGRPEETIRTWVGRARKGGWLGPSVKGRAGAEPGPKLLQPCPPHVFQVDRANE